MSRKPEQQRSFTLPQLDERVLSTLNVDGTRRWMSPREVRGRTWRARVVVAWALIAVFTALPWIRIDGKPGLLLDVMTRQFTFLGTTFRPTETLLLALLLMSVFVGIFLLTALLGRVWCGWGCPQTVYLEFVYRPLERLFLGHAYGKPGAPVAAWRRILMYVVFLALSAHLANTFLAYFVGTDRLVEWTFGAPSRHPVAFATFAVTVGLMMFDFAFFREQLCTLVCPYGRFQSVLLDRDSLVIGYDRGRGEPRMKGAARREAEAAGARAGDCVDCTMCVQVCPTGIDIRNGLQLECVNCAQCIDACDGIMAKVGKPLGLIRWDTTNRLEGSARKRFRFRLLAYPVLLAVLVTALAVLLARREPALVEQSRIVGGNFVELPGGTVETPVRLLVENRTGSTVDFTVRGMGDVAVVGGEARITVKPFDAATLELKVACPLPSFGRGSRKGMLHVESEAGFAKDVPVTIAGPFGTAKEATP